LRAAHYVTQSEENSAEQDHAEKQSYQVPAFENPVAASASCVACHFLYFFSSDFIHCEITSTGSGKITVVFFSTPISTSVCK